MTARIFFCFFIAGIFTGCGVSYSPEQVNSFEIILSDTLGLADAEASAIISPYRDSVSSVMGEEIGISGSRLYSAAPQGSLGNFVADLLYFDLPLYKEYEYLNYHPFFALINTRGLRASLPEGKITRGKIYEIMPFENKIVIARMPPETFSEVGEFLVDAGGHPFSKNVSLVGEGGRLETFALNNSQPSGEYFIITTDYLASGGDNMHFFSRAAEIKNTGILVRDQIVWHIEELTRNNKSVNAKTDERILLFR